VFSPSELARLTRVSTDTLRYYERKGVLWIPARSQGGYRLYPPEAVGRVRLVRRALAIGFTLPTGFYSGLRQIWRRSYSISKGITQR
jgi:DNA-binding transcriptional MerR regulator